MTVESQEKARELLANAAIVLVGPKSPENVGAAARAAANMGIDRLLLVCPRMPERTRMLALATHHAAHLIETMERHDDLGQALAPFAWVIGTSARRGRKRNTSSSPRYVLGESLPLLAENRVALLFGPEDRGLANEELLYCNQIITIPTVDFSSLNLAQAVAILCYELHSAVLQAVSGPNPLVVAPRQANKGEMEAMFAHVEEVFAATGFLPGGDQGHGMKGIRRFFGRLGLRPKEIKIIRGICRQLLRRLGPDCGERP